MKKILPLLLAFAAFAFADGAAPQNPQQGSAFGMFLPFILMFVVMWLFFIRPKQKEMKKLDEMRKALKKGDKVLTSAGILGQVAAIDGTTVTVKTGNDTRIDFEQSAILRVINPEEGQAKADEKKAAK